MAIPGISISHLHKTYRVQKKDVGLRASVRSLFHKTWTEVHAVSDLSFVIDSGERVGFLGPNGAGKTTTLKILAGLLTPTSGSTSVLGMNPQGRPRELLRRITLVMGQKQQLLWDLPPAETLELNRAIYEIERTKYNETRSMLLGMLEIEDLVTKPTRQLSLGERMRCELAAALIHSPDVLFLDEPTIGLDITMQAVVRRFIKEYNETTGATVLLTSHNMDDVAALCPRVVVIHHGRLRHDGNLAKLVADTRPHKRVTVHLLAPASEHALAQLGTRAHPIGLKEDAPLVLSAEIAPADLTEAVRCLLDVLPVADLRIEDPPLEEVMVQIFREKDARDAWRESG